MSPIRFFSPIQKPESPALRRISLRDHTDLSFCMGSHLTESIPQFQQNEYLFHFRFTSPLYRIGEFLPLSAYRDAVQLTAKLFAVLTRQMAVHAIMTTACRIYRSKTGAAKATPVKSEILFFRAYHAPAS